MNGRVLFYVQHLLGIGHLRRALRIAEALARQGVDVTLVSGGEAVAELGSVAAERVVQLPPIRSRDAAFTELIDGAGRPIDQELRDIRRQLLLSALHSASPDAVLIEAFLLAAVRFALNLIR